MRALGTVVVVLALSVTWTRAVSAQPTPLDVPALAKVLGEAPTAAARAALLDTHPDLVTHQLVEAVLDDGDATRNRLDLAAAADRYQLARSIAERAGDVDGGISALLSLGVLAGRQGDYADAMTWFRRALDENVSHNKETSAALNNIGILYRLQGDLDLALDAYRRSLAQSEATGNALKRGATLTNIGIVLMQQGKYREALPALERGLALNKEAHAANIGDTLAAIGQLHESQGNLDLALQFYDESLALQQAAGSRIDAAETLNAIGHVRAGRSQFVEALDTYDRALAIAKEADNKRQIGTALFNIALVLEQQGPTMQALDRLRESVSVRESIGDKAGMAEALVEMAAIARALSNPAAAREAAERAVSLAREGGNRFDLWKALTARGANQRLAGDLNAARATLLEAIADVETRRTEVAGAEQERQRFFESRLAPYRELLAVEVSAGRSAEALAVAERIRARVLLDVLQYGRSDVTKRMTPEELERERSVRRTLISENARLEAVRARPSATPEEIETRRRAIADARLAQDGFHATLYAAHPELQVQRGDLPAFDLDQAAAILPSGDAAIEFAVTAERTYGFVVMRDLSGAAVHPFVVPITRAALADRVERFRHKIAVRDLTIAAEARALYDLLLGPVRQEIAGRRTLTILPDGPLWELPFQALQPARGQYLIEQAAVSYAPSLSALREMQRLSRSRATGGSSRTIVVFGSSGVGAPGVGNVADGGLAPLVEAEAQARAVGALYGRARSALWVGREARSDRLKAEAARYRIVHVAAHGVLDDANPMQSYLVLAPPSAGAGADDQDRGLVDAADLMRIDVSAELVVLSACESARGRIGDGEGLLGLTWALFVAGAPSVVVSQWKVASSSTTLLMRRFHQGILAELTRHLVVRGRAAALRAAALSLLRTPQYRHPFYWAAFVVVGDGS